MAGLLVCRRPGVHLVALRRGPAAGEPTHPSPRPMAGPWRHHFMTMTRAGQSHPRLIYLAGVVQLHGPQPFPACGLFSLSGASRVMRQTPVASVPRSNQPTHRIKPVIPPTPAHTRWGFTFPTRACAGQRCRGFKPSACEARAACRDSRSAGEHCSMRCESSTHSCGGLGISYP